MPSFTSNVKSKLPQTGNTIFSIMSKMAADHGAINLSQGFPDFDCDPKLVERVSHYMKTANNQYAPMSGVPRLRERIAEKTEELYGCAYDVESEITVTSGATEAIYAAITSMVSEGDEVIIFTPAYDCYEPAIHLNGGKVIYVRTEHPTYKIDWEQVKKVITQRTRMIILNTPHNPTGVTYTETDLLELEKIVAQSDIVVLSDEVYEHIVFDGKKHMSAAMFPGLAERSFVVSSFGKTYHTTGWKLGYCLAPKELMTEFRKAHQFIVFSVNTPIQMAYADHLEDKEAYLQLGAFYQEKRDMFAGALNESRFRKVACSGTYFQLLDYSEISDMHDVEFAEWLTKVHKVASIPVSVFYHTSSDAKVLRFCFAKNSETLANACEILSKI